MINKYLRILTILLVLCACHHAPGAVKTAVQDSARSRPEMGVAPALKSLHFDYDKDPSCGMPLHAGLLDTTTYKGKRYGFCSKECKDAFLKDPAGFIAQIK